MKTQKIRELYQQLESFLDRVFSDDRELDKHLRKEELRDLLEAHIRLNDENIIIKNKAGRRIVLFLNEEYLREIIYSKIIKNLVVLDFFDVDVLELLLFSIEFAFSMIEGKTRATKTQKGFRERERELETIIVNTFIGLLGEVAVKKFIYNNFKIEIKLDRTISRDILKYTTDILNAKEPISIKTTPNLRAIWAECPKDHSVGIFVKASVPQGVLLTAMAHVCGFKKLLDFSKNILSKSEIIKSLENRIYYSKCGLLNDKFKCIICGFFETKNKQTIPKGRRLPFLGEVREERYLVTLSELRSDEEDWKEFVKNYLNQ